MSSFLSGLAEGLKPYVPGEQPGEGQYIKLNTNENPYPPSPAVIKAIKEQADERLRLYPDPASGVLTGTAADVYNVEKDMVFAGNGSDEILAFAFAAFYSGKKVVFPAVTYSFYPVYCKLFNVDYYEVPMKSGLLIDYDYMKKSGCGVVFANPNAPTGELASIDEIRDIAETNSDSAVLVDEAYIDFGGKSCIALTKRLKNLLVVQTLSKSKSLAGMRIGLAFGDPQLIKGLERVRDSFNSYPLDRLAQAAGAAAISDIAYYDGTRSKIIGTREETFEKMLQMGFEGIRSNANFMFVSHKTVNAKDIYEKLKDGKILVRYFNKPGIDDFIRVTVGTENQMHRLLECLEKIVGD